MLITTQQLDQLTEDKVYELIETATSEMKSIDSRSFELTEWLKAEKYEFSQDSKWERQEIISEDPKMWRIKPKSKKFNPTIELPLADIEKLVQVKIKEYEAKKVSLVETRKVLTKYLHDRQNFVI